jgi:hypothetical protein
MEDVMNENAIDADVIITAVQTLLMLGLTIGGAVYAWRKGKSADRTVTMNIQLLEYNERIQNRLHAQYEASHAQTKHAIKLAALALKVIAPLTPLTSDDAAASLLEEIISPDDEDTQEFTVSTEPEEGE